MGNLKDKVIITAALCGAGTTKAQNPNVPITPEEIAADVVACAKAGAAIVHLHVRDENGVNSMEPSRFIEVVTLARKACEEVGVDVIFNCTTSGGKWPEEKRLGHLPELLPEMCSCSPGTMNWSNSYVFLNTPQFIEKLGTLTQELKIKPEIEIFDAGMMGNLNYYIKKGFIAEPPHVQFVLGVTGGMPGNIESLSYLLPKLPEGATWSITGIGKSHMPMMLAGLSAGCNGLRVGLEDNIYMEKGVLATNVSLVERAVELCKVVGREIATPAEAREILGLVKQK